MKLLSIFTLIIAVSFLYAGLWLWFFVFACLAWHLYTRDMRLLRNKLYSIFLIWQSDAFIVYTREENKCEIKPDCSELDIANAKDMMNTCVDQTRAIKDVLDIVNGNLK